MELQVSFKAVNVQAQQHHYDLYPSNHILPHPSNFSLPDLLTDISNLLCDRSPFPNICLLPIFILPLLRNFSNREDIGWIGGWKWLYIVVAIWECAVKAVFFQQKTETNKKSPRYLEPINPLSAYHIAQTPQILTSLKNHKQSHMFKIVNGIKVVYIFRFQ